MAFNDLVDSFQIVSLREFAASLKTLLNIDHQYIEYVWKCIFKKIICIFKLNRNFRVFEVTILKTQI